MNGTTKQSLDTLVQNATVYLAEKGYAAATQSNYTYVWKHLLEYAHHNGITYFSNKIGYDFLLEKYHFDSSSKMTKTQSSKYRSIRVLQDFQEQGDFRRCYYKHQRKCPSPFQDLMEKCILSLEETLSKRTVAEHRKQMVTFLVYLVEEGIEDISLLACKHVLAFAVHLGKYAVRTREGYLYSLRRFLCWLHTDGYTTSSLNELFPVIPVNKMEKLPSNYSAEEVHDILESVDRSNCLGKRNYIILLLGTQMGIRAGDIRNLKMENIQWHNSTISFTQQKTGNAILIPFTEDTTYALIDYIKNSKSRVDSPYLFLRNCAPHEPFADSNTFFDIMRKYMKLADVSANGRKHGMHALRHSLAGNLLGKSTPVSVISGILGHESSETTSQYLRIDVEALRKLSLEVPHEYE